MLGQMYYCIPVNTLIKTSRTCTVQYRQIKGNEGGPQPCTYLLLLQIVILAFYQCYEATSSKMLYAQNMKQEQDGDSTAAYTMLHTQFTRTRTVL